MQRIEAANQLEQAMLGAVQNTAQCDDLVAEGLEGLGIFAGHWGLVISVCMYSIASWDWRGNGHVTTERRRSHSSLALNSLARTPYVDGGSSWAAVSPSGAA
jgi:hypothetical protein